MAKSNQLTSLPFKGLNVFWWKLMNGLLKWGINSTFGASLIYNFLLSFLCKMRSQMWS